MSRAAHSSYALSALDLFRASPAVRQADGSFDAVLLLGLLYHLPDSSGRALARREAHRAVEPGGPVAAAATTSAGPGGRTWARR
ncbi:methyltransferase domain-containing protein [Streptomyces sp. NBC_00096]|uniref:methyltransferase domain-containing protein n=1 Tax=Streptomyces sp. NBC_00096 TaxID=2975650 RepID=UPI0032566450